MGRMHFKLKGSSSLPAQTVEKTVEVVKEVVVPVEKIVETTVERIVEVVKEVPVEVIKYIEVPVEKLVEIKVEVVKEIEKIVDRPVEVLKEVTLYIDRIVAQKVVPKYVYFVMGLEAVIILALLLVKLT